MLASAIQSVGSVIQSFINRAQQKKNINKTFDKNLELARFQFDQNKEMARQANQYNIEQWERQMAYNNPTAQMERLKSAGLNPNMVYGTGTVAGNVTGTPPRSELAQYQSPEYQQNISPINIQGAMGVYSQYQDLAIKDAQIDNINAQTKLTGEQWAHETLKAMLTNFKGLSERTRYEMLQTLKTMYSRKLESEITGKEQRIELTSKQMEKYDQDIANLKSRKIITDSEASWLNTMKGNQIAMTLIQLLKALGGM